MQALNIILAVAAILAVVAGLAVAIILVTNLFFSIYDKDGRIRREGRDIDEKKSRRHEGKREKYVFPEHESKDAFAFTKPETTTEKKPDINDDIALAEALQLKALKEEEEKLKEEARAKSEKLAERNKNASKPVLEDETDKPADVATQEARQSMFKFDDFDFDEDEDDDDDFDFDDDFFKFDLEKEEEKAKQENTKDIEEKIEEKIEAKTTEEILDAYDKAGEVDEDIDTLEDETESIKAYEKLTKQINEEKKEQLKKVQQNIKELEESVRQATAEEKERLKKELDEVMNIKDNLVSTVEEATVEMLKIKEEKQQAEKLLDEKTKEVEALKQYITKLLAKKPEQPEQPVAPIVISAGSKEELLKRRETIELRLNACTKELKKVKKEYLPLNKLRRSLENDKKKLRRRDAIFVNQSKIVYGVNNYVDIDDEKAKKLNEEAELLMGLRTSVKNCEDILEKEKDRLPVLEQAYNILTAQEKDLKADLAEIDEQLAGENK